MNSADEMLIHSIREGGRFEVAYPFYTTERVVYVGPVPTQEESWTPGAKRETVDVPQYHGGTHPMPYYRHNGAGAMLLTGVAVAELPGRYQTRVFYIRRWRDPDGREFGKTTVRVTTLAAFRRLLQGHRHIDLSKEEAAE